MDEALAYVSEAFRGIRRKGSGVPYLAHLLAVAALVAEHGGNEDQIVAALLHDVLEDIPSASAADLEERFGALVSEYVVALSDTTLQPKPPWRERKLAYVAVLRSKTPDLKLISCADKLHNASSMLRDHAAVGDALFDRFTASRQQTLWYYRAVLDALSEGFEHPIVEELRAAVGALHRVTGEAFPSPN